MERLRLKTDAVKWLSLCLSVTILLPGSIACKRDWFNAKTSDPQSPSQPTETLRIRQRWEELTRSLDSRAKDYQYKRIQTLQALLREAPKEEVERELERVRSSPVRYLDMSPYDRMLLQALVEKLFDERDHKQLTYLLSGKCPETVGLRPIESAAAYRTPDDILILFDSYENSTNKDARSVILKALGRAFGDIRRVTKEDKEFVNASRKWFTANRSRIKVNPNYSLYDYKNKNLFVLIK